MKMIIFDKKKRGELTGTQIAIMIIGAVFLIAALAYVVFKQGPELGRLLGKFLGG